MQDLLLPSEVEFTQGESDTSADLTIKPCFFGYGTTLGNALRRVLLSSLPGSAVEAFKIKGVQHEFTSVEGAKEDVVQIILNLKQLAVKMHVDEDVVLKLRKKGIGELKAKDIEANANVEIINKDLVLATLTSDKEFEMDIIVGQGRGFKPAEDKDKQDFDLGTIVIDSIYNPVKDVGYNIEYIRVGDVTNYEKLNLHIETNGVVTPRQAINQATEIIMDHFNIITNTLGGPDMSDAVDDVVEETAEQVDEVEDVEEKKVEKKPKAKTKKKKVEKVEYEASKK
ncbi:MAG: DNA-directed RNA polymerase subunit alpha [bacterium]